MPTENIWSEIAGNYPGVASPGAPGPGNYTAGVRGFSSARYAQNRDSMWATIRPAWDQYVQHNQAAIQAALDAAKFFKNRKYPSYQGPSMSFSGGGGGGHGGGGGGGDGSSQSSNVSIQDLAKQELYYPRPMKGDKTMEAVAKMNLPYSTMEAFGYRAGGGLVNDQYNK